MTSPPEPWETCQECSDWCKTMGRLLETTMSCPSLWLLLVRLLETKIMRIADQYSLWVGRPGGVFPYIPFRILLVPVPSANECSLILPDEMDDKTRYLSLHCVFFLL